MSAPLIISATGFNSSGSASGKSASDELTSDELASVELTSDELTSDELNSAGLTSGAITPSLFVSSAFTSSFFTASASAASGSAGSLHAFSSGTAASFCRICETIFSLSPDVKALPSAVCAVLRDTLGISELRCTIFPCSASYTLLPVSACFRSVASQTLSSCNTASFSTCSSISLEIGRSSCSFSSVCKALCTFAVLSCFIATFSDVTSASSTSAACATASSQIVV